ARGRDGRSRRVGGGVKGVDRPVGGLIQNGLSRSLISQEFFPKGDPNRRFRHTLRNKCFFGASDPTADQRGAAPSFLKRRIGRRSCPSDGEPRPKSFSRAQK